MCYVSTACIRLCSIYLIPVCRQREQPARSLVFGKFEKTYLLRAISVFFLCRTILKIVQELAITFEHYLRLALSCSRPFLFDEEMGSAKNVQEMSHFARNLELPFLQQSISILPYLKLGEVFTKTPREDTV